VIFSRFVKYGREREEGGEGGRHAKPVSIKIMLFKKTAHSSSKKPFLNYNIEERPLL